MASVTIEKAKDFEEQAAADRSLGDELRKEGRLDESKVFYESANRHLKQATDVLQQELERPSHESDSDEDRVMRAKLADYFGSRGGIFRRLNKPEQALRMYEMGLGYEGEDTGSTYNLSNAITWSIILGHRDLSSPELKERLATIITRLQSQTSNQGERFHDWWAHADLAQFLLLDGQVDLALSRYEQGIKSCGPSRDYVENSLGVLRDFQQSPHGDIIGLKKVIALLEHRVQSM